MQETQTQTYKIKPCPKPRQTRADKWKHRPCVMRYRDFADNCRARGMKIPESGAHIIFVIPMPRSWSEKKKKEMDWKPHQQKPDIDNLIKAVLDAVHRDDSHIFDIRASKHWGREGMVVIEEGANETTKEINS